MTEEFKVFGVIGCGNVGAKHLHLLNELSVTRLGGLFDILPERSKGYADKFNCRSYSSYREMLADPSLDAISICTPHGLHAEMAIEAANAGKHVLVEKPMALHVADCERMIDAAEKNNVKLMVVKQNRFNVPIALTRDALLEGKLGKVFMVNCNVLWNRSEEYYANSNWRGSKDLEGGALYTQVSHFIDLLVWWFGDVTNAQTKLSTLTHAIDIEDCGSSILTFSSGVTGMLNWTNCVYNKNYEGSITIIAEKGTIKIGGQYLNVIEFWDVQSHPLASDIEFSDKPNSYLSGYQGSSSNHHKIYENVVAALLDRRYQVIEGNEGIKTIQTIEKIYGSAV